MAVCSMNGSGGRSPESQSKFGLEGKGGSPESEANLGPPVERLEEGYQLFAVVYFSREPSQPKKG